MPNFGSWYILENAEKHIKIKNGTPEQTDNCWWNSSCHWFYEENLYDKQFITMEEINLLIYVSFPELIKREYFDKLPNCSLMVISIFAKIRICFQFLSHSFFKFDDLEFIL